VLAQFEGMKIGDKVAELNSTRCTGNRHRGQLVRGVYSHGFQQ
jgi:hypothetical protein